MGLVLFVVFLTIIVPPTLAAFTAIFALWLFALSIALALIIAADRAARAARPAAHTAGTRPTPAQTAPMGLDRQQDQPPTRPALGEAIRHPAQLGTIRQ